LPLASSAVSPLSPAQGNPITDINFLCFANVSKPYPEHWLQMYSALRKALESAVLTAERQLLAQGSGPQGSKVAVGERQRPSDRLSAATAAAVRDLRSELDLLDLEWFVSVLSRLHINVFRVGCMLPPPSSSAEDSSRGNVMWPGVGAATAGSAAYLTASLFNHSCEPNVEVIFRRNDSTATFAASRDIDEVRVASRVFNDEVRAASRDLDEVIGPHPVYLAANDMGSMS
jgi:hypothetical protein